MENRIERIESKIDDLQEAVWRKGVLDNHCCDCNCNRKNAMKKIGKWVRNLVQTATEKQVGVAVVVLVIVLIGLGAA
jgi:hypothetical protein